MKKLIVALFVVAMALSGVAHGEAPNMTLVEPGSDLEQRAIALAQTKFDEEGLDRAKYVTAVSKLDSGFLVVYFHDTTTDGTGDKPVNDLMVVLDPDAAHIMFDSFWTPPNRPDRH